MEPFYFESQGDRLFAVYHPASDVFSRRAILFCAPVFSEYFRTYRYLRKVAESWSQQGFHAMRFDYFGTGDSSGTWADTGPERWMSDISVAARELRDVSGCDTFKVFGTRLGATLALHAASSGELGQKADLVLFDAIASGRNYLHQLHESHARLLAGSDVRTRKVLQALPGELAGFRRNDDFENQLHGIDLNEVRLENLGHVQMIFSSSQYVDEQLNRRIDDAATTFESTVINDDCDWATPSESALQAPQIAEWLRKCLQ